MCGVLKTGALQRRISVEVSSVRVSGQAAPQGSLCLPWVKWRSWVRVASVFGVLHWSISWPHSGRWPGAAGLTTRDAPELLSAPGSSRECLCRVDRSGCFVLLCACLGAWALSLLVVCLRFVHYLREVKTRAQECLHFSGVLLATSSPERVARENNAEQYLHASKRGEGAEGCWLGHPCFARRSVLFRPQA